jgi:hypothetical protein
MVQRVRVTLPPGEKKVIFKVILHDGFVSHEAKKLIQAWVKVTATKPVSVTG